MKRAIVLLALLVFACGKSDVTAEDAEKVVRETLSEAKEKDVVNIQVRLEKTQMPTAEELELRRKIEEAIEKEGIGRVALADSGVGHIDVSVEVGSTADAVPRIRDLLESLGVLERSVVSVQSK